MAALLASPREAAKLRDFFTDSGKRQSPLDVGDLVIELRNRNLAICASFEKRARKALQPLFPDDGVHLPDSALQLGPIWILERALRIALGHPGVGTEPRTKALQGLTRLWLECPTTLEEWTHSLAHLFEGDPFKFDPAQKEDRGHQEQLLGELVRRCVVGHGDHNADRVLRPLLNFNLKHFNLARPGEGFAYRPEVLRNPDFVVLLRERQPVIAAFCSSDGPREFLRQALPCILRDASNSPLAKYLDYQLPGLGETELEPYWREALGVPPGDLLSLELLQKLVNQSRQAVEPRPGLFVDVAGTLLDADGHLKTALVDKMQRYQAKGWQVAACTGGSVEEARRRLAAAGFPLSLFSVVSKQTFVKTMQLELLVDDTVPEYQGFQAKRHFSTGELLPEP